MKWTSRRKRQRKLHGKNIIKSLRTGSFTRPFFYPIWMEDGCVRGENRPPIFPPKLFSKPNLCKFLINKTKEKADINRLLWCSGADDGNRTLCLIFKIPDFIGNFTYSFPVYSPIIPQNLISTWFFSTFESRNQKKKPI